VSYRTGEEQVHALDGDTFGLWDPNEGEDAEVVSDVSEYVQWGVYRGHWSPGNCGQRAESDVAEGKRGDGRKSSQSTHNVAMQQKAKNRKVPQTPIGLAIMLGNDSVEAY
jgi:hypothetical protein